MTCTATCKDQFTPQASACIYLLSPQFLGHILYIIMAKDSVRTALLQIEN